MQIPRLSQRVVAALAAAALLVNLNSCGTILHPERIGQRGGRIDPAIAVLDAAGLLLFFIPGVIAFAVDFANGTIYLPPEYVVPTGAQGAASQPRWHTLQYAPEELTPDRLEQVVGEQIGQPIDLQGDAVQVRKLEAIDRFDAEYHLLKAESQQSPAQAMMKP
jgi:hypothetical protein